MKRIVRSCSILLVLLSLASCATTLFAGIDNDLSTWMSAPEDELYLSWGPPQGSQALSNGGKVISYTRSQNLTTGGYYSGNIYTPQQNQTLIGKVLFTIDSKGIIGNWSYDGNYGAIRALVKPRRQAH